MHDDAFRCWQLRVYRQADDKKKLVLLCAVIATVAGASHAHAAPSIVNTYASKMYIDSGSSNPVLGAAYLSYDVTTDSARSDVWVSIDAH